MLRITIHENEKNRRIELAGTIAGQWVIELEKAWLSGLSPGKQTELDMRDVTSVDIDGRQLLKRMHSGGVRLVASGVAMTALVDEIGGTASSPSARHRRAKRLGLVALLLGLPLSLLVFLHAQQSTLHCRVAWVTSSHSLSVQDAAQGNDEKHPCGMHSNGLLSYSQAGKRS
jgi:hypothetical protein